jgi:rRNA maturation endonuclease Nob1
MGKKLVLDTSALFSMEQLPGDSEAFVTPGVIKELERYKDRRAILWGDLLRVSDASKANLAKVKKAASETGDSTRISPTDAEVIALALDLEAELLTDDYSVQNSHPICICLSGRSGSRRSKRCANGAGDAPDAERCSTRSSRSARSAAAS